MHACGMYVRTHVKTDELTCTTISPERCTTVGNNYEQRERRGARLSCGDDRFHGTVERANHGDNVMHAADCVA